MIKLTTKLFTGNVELNDPKILNVVVTLSTDHESTDIIFEFEEKTAKVSLDKWSEFYNQVNMREISKWKEGGYEKPLGTDEFTILFNEIHTNSAYQLFLASVDIANTIELHKLIDSDYISVVTRNHHDAQDIPPFGKLYYYIYDKIGGKLIGLDKALFILPYFSSIDVSSPAIEELIKFNQLGKIVFILENGEQLPNFYYRPYFSPFAFKGNLSNEAKEILKIISNLRKKLK
jgi:hypothetical protein